MRNFLIKEEVDKAIELTKKIYESYNPALWNGRESTFGDDNYWVGDIITGITYSQKDKNPPKELYYRVLEVLDFVIVERAKVFNSVEKEKGGKL